MEKFKILKYLAHILVTRKEIVFSQLYRLIEKIRET